MTQKERMLSGALYSAADPELAAARLRARQLTHQFNTASPAAPDYAAAQLSLLRQLLGRMGEGGWVEAPFRCDYGGNISVGDCFYANFGCVFLDVAPITIGSHAFLGPGVHLYTAAHPLWAPVRDREVEFGAPIAIGESVWIGGNTVVLPGVTIGDGTVVAAGSVVTKDLPANVVAAGNPCRVLRPITETDRKRWEAALAEYETDCPPED